MCHKYDISESPLRDDKNSYKGGNKNIFKTHKKLIMIMWMLSSCHRKIIKRLPTNKKDKKKKIPWHINYLLHDMVKCLK